LREIARVGGFSTSTRTPQLTTVAPCESVEVVALVEELEDDDAPQPDRAAAKAMAASRARNRELEALRRRLDKTDIDDSSRRFFAFAQSGVLASASTLLPAFQPAMGRGL